MAQQLFVPLTDDLMYDTPEMITSGLRPYRVDTPCYHWQVSVESNDAPMDGSTGTSDYSTGKAIDQHISQPSSGCGKTNVIPFPQELAA